MKQIYNEGRVVGYSMWEIYVRQLMSTNPEATPMTEREWLTSTLANNISMILKIPAGTSKGIHDYILPEGSNLVACTQVFGSMFQGQVALDASGHWATRVDDYGDVISNTAQLHPETPGTPEYVPSKLDPTQENATIVKRAKEFLKIRQAVIIQPGDWEDAGYELEDESADNEDNASTTTVTDDIEDTSDTSISNEIDIDEVDPSETVQWNSPIIVEDDEIYENPKDAIVTTEYNEWLMGEKYGTYQEMVEDLDKYKDDPEPGPEPPDPPTPPEPPVVEKANKYLVPNFKERGFVRILLIDDTEEDLYLLLTGFVDKIMLIGEVSFPYQGLTNRPEDGDFLGPAMYPWACPIILIISSDIAEVIVDTQNQRIDELEQKTEILHKRTTYLGTLHTTHWDTELESEDDDTLLTEYGEYLLGTKSGSVAQMWQDDGEADIVYFIPWYNQDDFVIVNQNNVPIYLPKFGTIDEMNAEGGIL